MNDRDKWQEREKSMLAAHADDIEIVLGITLKYDLTIPFRFITIKTKS